MEHLKRFNSVQLDCGSHAIRIEGPVTTCQLSNWTLHPKLDAFRHPRLQKEALLEITCLAEGRVIAARVENEIIGYVTFHYPDELEQWSQGNMEDLIELGAVEVADEYRGFGLGKRMIGLAFEEEQLENAIVFTTEYYWHWDLKGSGLDVWGYRGMMERLMKSAGMVWFATDDPEICSHPANCLMVRVGSRVPQASVEQFDRIRFRQRFMY
jgi:acetoin utilization protein AcuA